MFGPRKIWQPWRTNNQVRFRAFSFSDRATRRASEKVAQTANPTGSKLRHHCNRGKKVAQKCALCTSVIFKPLPKKFAKLGVEFDP
jgi:hypothetical protein